VAQHRVIRTTTMAIEITYILNFAGKSTCFVTFLRSTTLKSPKFKKRNNTTLISYMYIKQLDHQNQKDMKQLETFTSYSFKFESFFNN
jgi:hypothetical protein